MLELRGTVRPDLVAVVTGAAGGIGRAIAEAFLAEGARVSIADIDAAVLATTADELAERFGSDRVLAVVTDVSDPASVEQLATTTVAHFGALHVAVNNAGVVNRGPAWELSLDEWHRILDINLWGVIHGVRSFVPRIIASGQPGHVVNVASMAAVNIIPNLAPYTVSKHAVLGLSDALRADLEAAGHPINVSVVMPGRTLSRMNPIATLPASVVADNVVDALRRDRHYVFADDESAETVAARLQSIIDARGDRL